MNMRNLCLATSMTLILGAAANAAPVVSNGDFQTGDFTGWGTPAAGTTIEADAGDAGVGDYAVHITSGDWGGAMSQAQYKR